MVRRVLDIVFRSLTHPSQSHGVKRARETWEALQARRQKELSKIVQYRALSEDTLKCVGHETLILIHYKYNLCQKRERNWSPEALDLTKQLLAVNPEFYSIWNYRRCILVNGIFPTK